MGGLTEYWKTIIASKIPGEYEARLRRFDGVYRWFLFRAVPVKDQSGNVLKWYGQNIDVDDRKRAEDTVRANEHALRATINAIPTPAWSTRPDGHVEFFNQRWLDYAGMTLEQAQGWGWGTVIHPDDIDGLVRQWQLCLSSGVAAEAEARYRRFDGVYRWFLIRVNPLRDESGQVVKWYGTSTDIEDRKQADQALRASERNLRAIINTIPTLSWSTGPDGSVEFLSKRWLDFTGLTEEQALGFGWAVAICPEGRSPQTGFSLGRLYANGPHETCRHLGSGGPEDRRQNVRVYKYGSNLCHPGIVRLPRQPGDTAGRLPGCP